MPRVATDILKHFEARIWPQTLPEQNGLQDAIHAPHLAERDRYILALIDSSDRTVQDQARRMATCADSVHLYVDPDLSDVHEYLHRCKCRLCPLCARARSIHIGQQVEALVKAMKKPRHLVLTVKSVDVPLEEQLRNLSTWFAKLRHKAFWQHNVTSGVYTIECTMNERSGKWHPHIHCVFDGHYLPYKIIQRLWHGITNGSEIVWLEPVDDVHGMTNELCKYIGKPQDAEHWTDEQLRTYAKAIRGRRMMQTFGRSKPKPIEDLVPTPAGVEASWSISLSRVLWLADMRQESAYRSLILIAELYPHLGRYIYQRMPQLEPEMTKAERTLAIMSIIESGRAPPRHASPPQRAKKLIEAELVPLLKNLHDVKDEDLQWL